MSPSVTVVTGRRRRFLPSFYGRGSLGRRRRKPRQVEGGRIEREGVLPRLVSSPDVPSAALRLSTRLISALHQLSGASLEVCGLVWSQYAFDHGIVLEENASGNLAHKKRR